jgi:hypothetical protein
MRSAVHDHLLPFASSVTLRGLRILGGGTIEERLAGALGTGERAMIGDEGIGVLEEEPSRSETCSLCTEEDVAGLGTRYMAMGICQADRELSGRGRIVRQMENCQAICQADAKTRQGLCTIMGPLSL